MTMELVSHGDISGKNAVDILIAALDKEHVEGLYLLRKETQCSVSCHAFKDTFKEFALVQIVLYK
jgi:hypothetical protein